MSDKKCEDCGSTEGVSLICVYPAWLCEACAEARKPTLTRVCDWFQYGAVRYSALEADKYIVGVDRDGKARVFSSEDDITWLPNCDGWDWKPPVALSYRPFANALEFAPHRDRWIVRWGGDGCFRADVYDDTSIVCAGEKTGYAELMRFVFDDDGTPCGVIVN